MSTSSEFEIVIGPMQSGKTSYARSKSNYVFLSHDEMMGSTNWKDFGVLFDRVVSVLRSEPEKNFIIDGWFSVCNKDPATVVRLQQLVPQKVKIIAFYAPMDTLLGRKPDISHKYTKEDILPEYEMIASFYKRDLKEFPFTFRDSERAYTFYEFMRKVRSNMVTATPEEVDAFIAELAGMPHDRYYQTVPLPHGKTIKGYERTELTWDLVLKRVDFRGKTVLDAGSYHCYTAFGAEDAGASRVVGVDHTPTALTIADRLKRIWGYETELLRVDLDDWEPGEHFDIVLCFNTIQYPKKTEEVIRKLFGCGDLVIWEAHEKYKPMFENQSTHRLVREEESPRWKDLLRKLYYYKKV